MRPITQQERPLIAYLFESAGLAIDLDAMKVHRMSDGWMGGLQLDRMDAAPAFGQCVAECEFRDADGVLVLAVLNVDALGQPMEIDLWKVDFSAMMQWPGRTQIARKP